MKASMWLVLDNLKNGWNHWANVNKDLADKAYLECVNNEYIKDGKLTDLGKARLLEYRTVVAD